MNYTFTSIKYHTSIFFRKSDSHAHVSALLYALTSMTFLQFELQPPEPLHTLPDNDEIPVTSLPCQWEAPKQRKDSTLQMAEATFEKHVYRSTKKRKINLLNDFDSQPEKFRGHVKDCLPSLLEKLHGKGLHMYIIVV